MKKILLCVVTFSLISGVSSAGQRDIDEKSFVTEIVTSTLPAACRIPSGLTVIMLAEIFVSICCVIAKVGTTIQIKNRQNSKSLFLIFAITRLIPL